MKRMATGLTALLSVAIVASGCSKATEEPAAASPTAAATATPTPKEEKLTLKWYVSANNNYLLPSADKDFVKKYIDEKFNVDLKIEHMIFSPDRSKKLNLMLASGDVPDMFVADAVDANKYITDGLVKDLTKFVTPQTMPNYFKWVSEDDVKRYQVQKVFKRAPIPFDKKSYISYYIRKDWLDNLGLKIPETYDDMIKVMKAFTENDPDKNGKKDTFGFTTAGAGTMIYEFPEFYNAGFPGGLFLEGDQFIDRGSDIRIAKALDDLRTTIASGVIDPDWFLQKPPSQMDKAAQGKAGMFYSINKEIAFDNSANSIQKRTKEVTKNDKVDWQPFHPWAKTGVNTEALPGNPFLFGANTSDAKVQRSIKILDWLASEEGFLMTTYGQAGKHYTKDGNKVKINETAFKADISDNGNFLDIYGFFTPDTPELFGLEKVDPRETDRDREIVKKLLSYKYVPSLGTNVATPAGVDLAGYRTQMRNFHTKIVMEEKNSTNWPKYRQELMTKYGGKQIFDAYAAQVSEVLGKKVTYKSEN